MRGIAFLDQHGIGIIPQSRALSAVLRDWLVAGKGGRQSQKAGIGPLDGARQVNVDRP